MGSNVLDKDVQKATGAHYTPLHLSDFVAQKIAQAWAENPNHSNKVKVLDPAIGDGELIMALIKQLENAGVGLGEVHGFDIDNEAVSTSLVRVANAYPGTKTNVQVQDFLQWAAENFPNPGAMPLFSQQQPYDLVITNPPYVRTQHLGQEAAQKLAKSFGIKGRVDLYHAFIMALAGAVAPGGIAGIIVSNRFMVTRAGQSLREHILEHFEILHLWDLGDTRIFEAAVLPAVLLLRRKKEGSKVAKIPFTSIYSCDATNSPIEFSNPMAALSHDGYALIGGGSFRVKHGELLAKAGDVWALHNEDSNQWLEAVKLNTYCSFADIGKIRVGVKTTADKIFIKQPWDKIPINERPEALKPLITHHVSSRYFGGKPVNQILYPYISEGGKRKSVNFENNPRTLQYLRSHYETLASRTYIQESGREWWEVWVPHQPKFWEMPKIVFRDISLQPEFWLDRSGAIVNGDCYWIACEDEGRMDLFWLALAVGNSEFIEKFYDTKFNNKLYAGRRRFITQYVNQFPLPDPKKERSQHLITLVKDIYARKETGGNLSPEKEAEVNSLVNSLFGVS